MHLGDMGPGVTLTSLNMESLTAEPALGQLV